MCSSLFGSSKYIFSCILHMVLSSGPDLNGRFKTKTYRVNIELLFSGVATTCILPAVILK